MKEGQKVKSNFWTLKLKNSSKAFRSLSINLLPRIKSFRNPWQNSHFNFHFTRVRIDSYLSLESLFLC